MYAEEIDQLFYTNAYGVGVNETRMMYGVPGRRLQFWLQWRDPWPHEIDEFDEMKVSLYGLFDRGNLLDFIRHFIVFVTKDGKTEKVVVRYQQYLAVKDILNRATDLTLPAEKRRGLIWHTQGSGKTLTMIYAARSLWEDPKLQQPTVIPVGGPGTAGRSDGPRAQFHWHRQRACRFEQTRSGNKAHW
jgi:type I restriction enzyme, R subunit